MATTRTRARCTRWSPAESIWLATTEEKKDEKIWVETVRSLFLHSLVVFSSVDLKRHGFAAKTVQGAHTMSWSMPVARSTAAWWPWGFTLLRKWLARSQPILLLVSFESTLSIHYNQGKKKIDHIWSNLHSIHHHHHIVFIKVKSGCCSQLLCFFSKCGRASSTGRILNRWFNSGCYPLLHFRSSSFLSFLLLHIFFMHNRRVNTISNGFWSHSYP
jgi:hypothetical protein